MEPRKHRVTAIQRASIAKDGSTIDIEIAGDDFAGLTLAFTVAGLEGFAGQATQMVAVAQSQQEAGAPGQVRATEVDGVSVVAAAEAGKVIVRLRSPSGLVYSFALSPSLAEQIRPELLRAAYAARHGKTTKN